LKYSFYKKITLYSNQILKENINYYKTSLSSLHIIKSHNDYFNITERKINQDNIFKKIQKKYFFRINNSKKKIKKKEVLIISNFTNKNLLSRKDRYFHHIVQQLEIEKKDFNIIYRNLNNYKINQTKKYNFYILNNNSKITKDLYYLFKILVEIFKIIFSKINKLFYKMLIIKNLLKIKNITSSIHNLNHVDDLMEQIKAAKPKKIFLTYEGYPWERLLCKKIKDFDEKIVIFGYFFSVMLKYTNTPLLKLNNSFDPDIILTPSNFISQSFLKKKFKKKEVINIGSIKSKDLYLTKSNKKDKNRNYFNCLILPESYDNEVKFLINFAKKTLDQKLKIKYLLRLHPSINSKEYLDDIKNYIGKYNISLSNSSLNNDINNCNITFYRGSSSVIEAASKGLIPLYIKKQNELSLDVLYKLEKFKPKIRSIYDFYSFYNIYKMKDYSYNKRNNDKIIDYCRSYYSLINKKKISKIINYKY
jgi:hypothetical protein